eukprot:65254-Pelagomonas_calceolata.AAC.1
MLSADKQEVRKEEAKRPAETRLLRCSAYFSESEFGRPAAWLTTRVTPTPCSKGCSTGFCLWPAAASLVKPEVRLKLCSAEAARHGFA